MKVKCRKKLTLMAEVQCWAIWELSKSENINPETLPLTKELIDNINCWSDRFDNIYRLDDPDFHLGIGFASKQEENSFFDDGWLLLEKLRNEIPNIEWWYRDQRHAGYLRERSEGKG